MFTFFIIIIDPLIVFLSSARNIYFSFILLFFPSLIFFLVFVSGFNLAYAQIKSFVFIFLIFSLCLCLFFFVIGWFLTRARSLFLSLVHFFVINNKSYIIIIINNETNVLPMVPA